MLYRGMYRYQICISNINSETTFMELADKGCTSNGADMSFFPKSSLKFVKLHSIWKFR